jgi:hypothetical protein
VLRVAYAEGTFRHPRFGHDRLAFQIEELVEFILEESLYQVHQEQNHRHEGQTTLASESLDRLPMAFQKIMRGIAKGETEAVTEVFQTLKRRRHPEAPPPTISDGQGGIDDAMVEVYSQVPEYQGVGRPPTRKRPQPAVPELAAYGKSMKLSKCQSITEPFPQLKGPHGL